MRLVTVLLLACNMLAVQGQSNGTCSSSGLCSPVWETYGDLSVGIIGNIHTASTDGRPCSVFSMQEVELIEAIIWLYERIYNADYVPSVAIGVKVYDACDRSDIASMSVASMLPYFRFSNISTPKQVAGIIGLLSSTQALQVMENIKPSNVPLISPTATSTSLTNTSNFFRTIPSDQLQMKVLYEIVRALSIKYFAVVYSDDDYGRQGARQVEQYAKMEGVACVAGNFTVSTLQQAQQVIDSLKALQLNLNYENLPVVFVGYYIVAERLVTAAGNAGPKAERLLWILPEAVGIDSALFNSNPRLGKNAISVSSFYTVVSEFKDYWVNKVYDTVMASRATSSYPDYYREYVETALNCKVSGSPRCSSKTKTDLRAAYSQSAYMNTVLNAAFVFAKAIKSLHAVKCNANNGLCPQLKATLQSLNNTQLIDTISNTDIDYSNQDKFSFIPKSFESGVGRVQFQPTGDLAIENNVTLFMINNAKCFPTCSFQTVGQANALGVTIDKAKVTFYLDDKSNVATTAENLPSLTCQEHCETCVAPQSKVPFAGIWGEYLIVAAAPVHSAGEGFSCGNIRDSQSVEDVEAMLFAMDTFNNNTGPWAASPSLAGKLGILIFDSCTNPLHAGYTLTQWLNGILPLYDSAGRLFDPSKSIGVIGGLSSNVNAHLLSISDSEKLIQIGYAASSLELPFNGSSFLRPIPADDIQARAMVDMAKSLGFTAFSVIYLQDSYGINGYEQLKLLADEAAMCINVAEGVPQDVTERDLQDIIQKLHSGLETQLVIVFTLAEQAQVILQAVSSSVIHKRLIWMGSEGWGARPALIADPLGAEALGMITVDLTLQSPTNYGNYFASLKPDTNTRNQFFGEWWQMHFKCNLSSLVNPSPNNKCSDSLSAPTPEDVQTATLAMKAVWTMALGFSKVYDQLCQPSTANCSQVIRTDESRRIVADEIRNTELLSNGKPYKVYTDRGDGNLDLILWNVQNVKNQNQYVEVASYRPDQGLTFQNGSKPLFYDASGDVVDAESICLHCDDCLYTNPDDPLIEIEKNITVKGAWYIVALLPMHESTDSIDPSNGEISATALAQAESLVYAVKEANKEVFGTDMLGLVIYDTYADKDLAVMQAMLALEAGRFLKIDGYSVANKHILCVISDGTGLDASAIADALENKDIFDINIGLDFVSLVDNGFNLGYTMYQEIEALLAVVQHYGWDWVTVVYSDSKESIMAKDIVQQVSETMGICLTKYLKYSDLVGQIQKSGTPDVLIMLLDDSDLRNAVYFVDAEFSAKTKLVWSRSTRALQRIGVSSNKKAFNNTVGVSKMVDNSNNRDRSIINNLESLTEAKYNPWMRGNLDKVKSTVAEGRVSVSESSTAIFNIAKALRNLLLDECGKATDPCSKLLPSVDWRNSKFREFLKGQQEFQDALITPYSKVMLDIFSFKLVSVKDRYFEPFKLGSYNTKQNDIAITNEELEAAYRLVKSQCEGGKCDECAAAQAQATSSKFPGWGIAIIIILLILFLLVILLGLYIWHLLKSSSENTKPYREARVESHPKPINNGNSKPYTYTDTVNLKKSHPMFSMDSLKPKSFTMNGKKSKANIKYTDAFDPPVASDDHDGPQDDKPYFGNGIYLTKTDLNEAESDDSKISEPPLQTGESDWRGNYSFGRDTMPKTRNKTDSPMKSVWLYETGMEPEESKDYDDDSDEVNDPDDAKRISYSSEPEEEPEPVMRGDYGFSKEALKTRNKSSDSPMKSVWLYEVGVAPDDSDEEEPEPDSHHTQADIEPPPRHLDLPQDDASDDISADDYNPKLENDDSSTSQGYLSGTHIPADVDDGDDNRHYADDRSDGRSYTDTDDDGRSYGDDDLDLGHASDTAIDEMPASLKKLFSPGFAPQMQRQASKDSDLYQSLDSDDGKDSLNHPVDITEHEYSTPSNDVGSRTSHA